MLIIRYFILLLENRLELLQTLAGLIKSLTFTCTGIKVDLSDPVKERAGRVFKMYSVNRKRDRQIQIGFASQYHIRNSLHKTPCILYLTDINQAFTSITYPYEWCSMYTQPTKLFPCESLPLFKK
jgi:hypothetical protein